MWHITENYLEREEVEFKPRIPISRMCGENDTIPRICFSETIYGALEAIKDHCIAKIIYTQIQNKKKENLTLYLYEPKNKINKKDIITNQTIIEKKYVEDAKNTKEVWALKPVTLKLVKTITIDKQIIDDYWDRMRNLYTAGFRDGEVNWDKYLKEVI